MASPNMQLIINLTDGPGTIDEPNDTVNIHIQAKAIVPLDNEDKTYSKTTETNYRTRTYLEVPFDMVEDTIKEAITEYFETGFDEGT